MSQEQTYQQKFLHLKEWMPAIIETVKKDLKNEHLKQDYAFIKKYFPGKNVHKVENEELANAYSQAIQEEENGNNIAEFIANRWIFRHGEMYHLFEENLSAINPNFTEIKELTDQQAEQLTQKATQAFGALRTYIFSLLNSVALSPAHFKKLAELARQAHQHEEKETKNAVEKRSLEELQSSHEREIARLTDKYEKKLIGVQKKYTHDVDVLKKQLANLQRKLA